MSFLDRILEATRARVEHLKTQDARSDLEARAARRPPARDLRVALAGEEVSIIAEIKRRSPSRGPLNPDVDARAAARVLADAGAAALSVLTEPAFFAGSLADLEAASTLHVPVLRKDFVVDPIQVVEARAYGADAVLLIARVVGRDLKALRDRCADLGMTALVEIFDEDDARLARDAGAELVGVNHRDLDSFEVDAHRMERLAPEIDSGALAVALSGVENRSDVEMLAAAGAQAVLVGEAVMTAADPAAKLRELRGVSTV